MARRRLTLADLSPSLDLEGRRVRVDEGTRRIAVRVANYGEVHSGFGPEVKVPRNANLDAAHVGSADLEDGSHVRVAVLPMHTPHAPTDLTAMHAASWYENSGTAVARGRYSKDESGIRFDGVLFDDIDDAKVDRLVAGSVSGDWRAAIALKSFGDFEHAPSDFVGGCLVNIGGYSDTYRQAPAERFALVASAAGDFISIEDGTMKDQQNPATPAQEPAGDTLTAGGGCDGGTCTTCDGSCNGERPKDAEPVVTITASALRALVDRADGDDFDAARVEGANVLIAGGFMAAPDPNAERLSRLEQFYVDSVFDRED